MTGLRPGAFSTRRAVTTLLVIAAPANRAAAQVLTSQVNAAQTGADTASARPVWHTPFNRPGNGVRPIPSRVYGLLSSTGAGGSR